jgi:hypothetical protein
VIANNTYHSLLPPSTEMGKLRIMHLKRYWNKALLIRENKLKTEDFYNEWQVDKILLFTLGLGLEQTMIYLYQTAPVFDEFENWIIKTAGKPGPRQIERFNNLFTGACVARGHVPDVLTSDELRFWKENGYIIIRNAIPKAECEKTIDTICRFIDINRNDPLTWYKQHPARQGIMVQLFQDPILQKNRQSVKIRKVFEQLWNRTDIWITSDRVGFNPPETDKWKFPGPRLHWDVSVEHPVPFGTQGLLYLADTEKHQGAFTLVPGFQHRMGNWLNTLPPGADPRRQNLEALGSVPIAANAGDFIIWLQALPHGSSPNTSLKPRFVQYFNYKPASIDPAEYWILQ